MNLALERRPAGLETIIQPEQPAGGLEAETESYAVPLPAFEHIPSRSPRVGPRERAPRRHPRMIPEQERARRAFAQEPAPLHLGERVAVHQERLLVVAAQRGGAAERVALEHRQDALAAE